MTYRERARSRRPQCSHTDGVLSEFPLFLETLLQPRLVRGSALRLDNDKTESLIVPPCNAFSINVGEYVLLSSLR